MRLQIEIPDEFKVRMVWHHDSYLFTLKSLFVLKSTSCLHLRHEPTNVADINAIRVFLYDIPIGYLIREDALSYNKLLHVLDFLGTGKKTTIKCFFVDIDKIEKTKDGRCYYELIIKIVKKSN
jgi:hypothetical protein